MENKKPKFIRIIYDPLNLYNAEDALILDELATPFEFRAQYENFREKGGEILILIIGGLIWQIEA